MGHKIIKDDLKDGILAKEGWNNNQVTIIIEIRWKICCFQFGNDKNYFKIVK